MPSFPDWRTRRSTERTSRPHPSTGRSPRTFGPAQPAGTNQPPTAGMAPGGRSARSSTEWGWAGVGAAGGDAPDQEAWFRLLQPPALGLFAPVVVTAERGEVTGIGGVAVVPGAPCGPGRRRRRAARSPGRPSGVAGADQVLQQPSGAVVVVGLGVVARAADDLGPGEAGEAGELGGRDAGGPALRRNGTAVT